MDSEHFSEVFADNRKRIKAIALRFHRSSNVPVEEFISQLNEELWISYEKYDGGRGASMNTWINMRLRDRARRIVRDREGSYYRRITTINGADDEDARTFKVVDESHERKKKEADQRELIDFLTNDPVKVDGVTTRIVTQFPQHPSITALAKALGLHHEIVKRKLRALSRHYDANRFGDYREYLAV